MRTTPPKTILNIGRFKIYLGRQRTLIKKHDDPFLMVFKDGK